ncbi:MAG TPA: RsmB/NOP family class I SAM-dependent RNA methyltransferase [Burkholderiales bacterium]
MSARPTPALLQATSDALGRLLEPTGPADALLHHYFREQRQLGPRERGFVAETCYGVLRHLIALRELLGKRSPRRVMLAWLVRWGGASLRDLEPCLRGDEAEWLAELKATSPELSLSARAELPEWLLQRVLPVLGEEESLALGRALQQSAPMDLRVNLLRAKREDVLARLAADGIEARATPYSPAGVRLAAKAAINRHPLYLEGAVEVQDEGSQLLGWLTAPRRGEMVVDFCAGAGGKTLVMGALMQSLGRLYAFDVSDKRLAGLKPRLKRSGLSNVHPQRIDSENDAKVKRLAGKIDRVLVDAPCSGFGTLRRNPDFKIRQTPQSVAELSAKQAAILEGAARLPKPGGRLVYATCSFLPEENEAVVEAFLARHPDYRLLDCAALLAEQKIPLDTGPYLRLLPHRHDCDGFFAAALERA